MKILKKIKKFFIKSRPEKNKRMIDYRKKCWGHNIEFMETNKDGSFKVYGWCSPRPKEGDLFLHKFQKGIGVCILMDIELCNDPADMYFAKAGIIRYADDKDYARVSEKSKGELTFIR